ncbi:MAG TPA: response regulator [Gemmataceae bacterium]|jgi:CheY-like chemotaxis protein|nr:response regulator [Gemmataceae bacterium]
MAEPVRVLVVEDCRDTAVSQALLLEMAGYEVRLVHDGPAAFREAATFRPDAVLLDINLPGMDGYQVAEQIRRKPALRRVRLIAVTGYGQAKDIRRGREAGFDHYLIKPADPEELLRLLAAEPPAAGNP